MNAWNRLEPLNSRNICGNKVLLSLLSSPIPSSETQGREEKARRTFSSTGGKALGSQCGSALLGTDSHGTISRRSSQCWLLIGHNKMICIIVPNRRTVFPEFFSWVRTRRLFKLNHGLSGSCTKEMHAVRKLSVWYELSISKYGLPEN